MSFNDRCGEAAEILAHGGVIGEAARGALVEMLREARETCNAPRDLVMAIRRDPANADLLAKTADGEWYGETEPETDQPKEGDHA